MPKAMTTKQRRAATKFVTSRGSEVLVHPSGGFEVDLVGGVVPGHHILDEDAVRLAAWVTILRPEAVAAEVEKMKGGDAE